MTIFRKQALSRFLSGGFLLTSSMSALSCFWNGTADPIPSALAERRIALFGSYPMALTVQTLLLLFLGGLIGLSTLPFDATGRALALHSLFHFFLTGTVVLLTTWDFLGADTLDMFVFFLALYVFLYLSIWLTRYLSWRQEVELLRRALDLPQRPPSPLRWRENLPYLILLSVLFLFLRPFAEVINAYNNFDIVPFLRGFLLPFFAYPFISLLIGGTAGWYAGGTILTPLAAFVSFLPNLFYSDIRYNLRQAAVYAFLALLSQTAGQLTRRIPKAKENPS